MVFLSDGSLKSSGNISLHNILKRVYILHYAELNWFRFSGLKYRKIFPIKYIQIILKLPQKRSGTIIRKIVTGCRFVVCHNINSLLCVRVNSL